MFDHVSTMLREGLPARSGAELGKLDRALFPVGSDRDVLAEQYARLMRHPELLFLLTIEDTRLTPVPEDPLLPYSVSEFPVSLLTEAESLGSDYSHILLRGLPEAEAMRALWLDSDEGLLKLGAAAACLAYNISKLRGYSSDVI
jgi:hypothetical protein